MAQEKLHPIVDQARDALAKGMISRRDFLRVATLLGVSYTTAQILAACGPAAPTATPVAGATSIPATTVAPATTPEKLIDPPTQVDMQICESFASKYGLKNCKFDPVVTITTDGLDAPEFQYKNGESLTDNVHIRWAKQVLGIEQKYLWVVKGSGDDWSTKVSLSLSAGEVLPDYLALGPGPLMDNLIDSGNFMEVGPLFDKVASDTYKKVMEGSAGIWNPYIRNGKRMALPKPNNWVVFDPVMWIRRDWLKKLNLEVPKTIDDLEKVMDAFTNQDPDGDGKKDSYGMVVSLKNGASARIGDASWLFGAYGTIPMQWNMSQDGKSVVYGSVQPEAKLALEKLNLWLKKGYINPEAGIMGDWLGEEAAQAVAAGKVGIVFAPYWLGWNLLLDLNKNVPEADMWPFQIPAGPNGQSARHGSDVNAGAIVINKDCKHPEAIIYYNDYFYNIINPPPTGGAFEWGMHENYMWAKDSNGNPTVDKSKIPGGWVNAGDYALTGYPINPLSEYNANIDFRQNKISTPFDKIYAGWPESQHVAQGILLDSRKLSWMNVYTGPTTATMKQYNDILKTMELETYGKIANGDSPLSAFDDFVKKWTSSGGEQITKEVNDWYKALGG